MKKTNGIPLVIAALCLAFTGALAAADEGYQITVFPREPVNPPPTKANKATGFLGMTVRNQFDERLGKIKDVVFDLESERVAYAVLAARGGIVQETKLMAVPLSAFTVSADKKYLILRAERGQIATASGFAQNDWPSVSNPMWGAQPFWVEPPGKSTPAKKIEPAVEPVQENKEDQTPDDLIQKNQQEYPEKK